MKIPFSSAREDPIAPTREHTTSPSFNKEAQEIGVDSSASSASDVHIGSDGKVEGFTQDAQDGVKKVEALTSTWSKRDLYLAYIFIWIIYFVDAMQQSATGSLSAYVTSSFYEHSLTATTGIMSSLIGGLWSLPLAKILDLWGRPQGFLIMLIIATLGLIMMAACKNVATYAAAQVFYWVGFNGMNFTMSIFIADTSALKNRGFAFAFVSSPYIVTVWIGGPIAQSFLETSGWRWAFGTFAIITPVMCSPLYFLMAWNTHKAKKAGLLPKTESNRTTLQSIAYYAIEFDIVGVLILAAGLAMFLLSFNLYSTHGWKSATIICMIVIGGLLIIGFALYEKFFAPKCFIPFELLSDRTVLGGCILGAVLFVEFYIWDSYFYSFIQVVNNLDVTKASYVTNIYSIGSCFWALVVGLAIRVTGRFKWIALYFGLPMTILGCGLMIKFRQPDSNIGYIVMCQIFIALGGGALVICEQVAVMAVTTHQYVAVVLAVQAMFTNVGGAIGQTIAGAIWTGVFPKKLAQNLPAESIGNLTDIYGSLVVQLSYEVGSPTRIAIQKSYGETQKLMLIASTVVLILAIAATAVWRDVNVKNLKQVKGVVL
ncbi:putative siderophore iron transporter mirB [Coleophoma cylindrospora]|uniref:Putative siderophore iron transporter mirB n=1 Tax=Coleophoma cylindrospora TaxID=1849047 RepID=A0A3D8QDC7_9HELO|nr:putative siderophore iron transporter mirB [Coleophoma cylindrospora]